MSNEVCTFEWSDQKHAHEKSNICPKSVIREAFYFGGCLQIDFHNVFKALNFTFSILNIFINIFITYLLVCREYRAVASICQQTLVLWVLAVGVVCPLMDTVLWLL